MQQAAAKPFIKSRFLTGSDMGLAAGIIILTVLFPTVLLIATMIHLTASRPLYLQ